MAREAWRAASKRLGEGLLRASRRRLTPAGQLAAVGLVASAALGIDTTRNMAHQLFTMLAALLGLAAALNLLWRPRLSVRWRLPRHGTAGQPLPYAMAFVNHGRRPERGLEAAPLGLEEPLLPLPDLPPGGGAELRGQLACGRRGRLDLAGALAAKTEPLGLARALRPVPAAASVIVLPRTYPVAAAPLPGARRYQPGGVALASAVGESQEFTALRDYRPGDALRKLHWKSWAKAGRPIVKEYQDEHFVRHALALDTAGPAGAAFEEAVSVAASFAADPGRRDALLDLLFVGDRSYCFTAGRGQGTPERLLEVLACASARPERPFADLSGSLLRRRASLSGCILVLLGFDDERRALVRRLRAEGLPALALAVAEPLSPAFEPEPGVHRLEAGRAAEVLARL